MKKYIIYMFGLYTSTILFSQQQEVAGATEEMDSVKFYKLKKSYERLVMVEREELTLIKVDLLGPMVYAFNKDNDFFFLSFEQKFKPDWSWIVNAEANANELFRFPEVRFRGGVRYYYNIKKRILKGKSANNFSANYLSLRYSYINHSGASDIENEGFLEFLFGVQRRLWKYGFVDFNVAIGRGHESEDSLLENIPSVEFNFSAYMRIGIAF